MQFFLYFCNSNQRTLVLATLISLIIGCISIGIILSAPMGPIGILTVQRTLSKGRESGWFTGLGAAASDLFYCLLTGLGISFVNELSAQFWNDHLVKMPLDPPQTITFGVALPDRDHMTGAARKFLGYTREFFESKKK